MEAITVIILALLGFAGGRNILLSKEEEHPAEQVIDQELSRYPALGVKSEDQLKTVDEPYPGQQPKKNFIDDKILELTFKDLDNLAAINEALIKHDTNTAEAKEDDVCSVKVCEDGNKINGITRFEDRALVADYCVNGTQRVGDSCWPVA